jgi:hypothetical protein
LIYSAIINVPGDYSTIQQAINAAVDGDEIIIAAGTYTETLSVGKSITFIGSGPAVLPTTIITSTANPMINLTVTNKSYTFRNIIIEGNVTNNGIRAGGSININSLTMQDVIARNCQVALYLAEYWPGADPLTTTVNNLLMDNVTLMNNKFIGAYIGKTVLSGTVTNCTVTGNGYSDELPASWQKTGLQFVNFDEASVPHVVVTNSTFLNNGVGASNIERTGLIIYSAYNAFSPNEIMTVSGCTFTNHPLYAVRIKNGYNVGNTATVNGTFSGNYLDIWFNNIVGSTSSTTLVRNTFLGTKTVGADPTYDYNTIQAAINASVDGDIINVSAGNYEEQLTIDNKSLTIQGADVNSTFINSPVTLAATWSTPSVNKCVVGVINNGNMTLQNLTVDGLGRGNSNNRFVGVGFRNSGGTVQNCKLLNIKDTPFSGAQHGVAIYSYNDDPTTRNINVLNNEIAGFQKNAMALNASDTNPLIVNVDGNTITGYGATNITAQNGIQVLGDIVTGTIHNNILSGIGYSGTGYVATTILNYYANVDIVSNSVTNGHVGVYNIDGISNILNNNFTVQKIGDYCYGIIATDPPSAVPSPFDIPQAENKVKNNSEALTSVLLDGNTITFSGPDNTYTYGIEADAGYGPNDLSITATNNSVSGFGVGFGVYNCTSGCDVGIFTSLVFNNNDILNNTIGFETNLVTPVNAENNWWGTAVESEIQAMISGNVDYDPWVGKTNTLNCTSPNVNYNFLNGVILKFITLPIGGGNVTVMRENQIPTAFPAEFTNLGMWIDLTSVMANYSFNAIVIADVSSLPDFDATTTPMYYNASTSSWVAIAGGTYTTSDPLFGGHPSFSFTTNHFTPFTYINTPATAYDVYVSSGTTASAGYIYPNDSWGTTAYEPPYVDWDFTAPISLYIVPEVGSIFGASDITVQWDNTMFSYVGVDKTGGIYDNPAYQFFYDQLGTTNSVTINASRTDNNNFNITAGQYIAKLNLNLLTPGFGPVSFNALDFRAFDGLGSQLGVFVTGNNAQVKSYLGDVAATSPASTATGDGLVNFDDLSPWSISYWSGVGGFGMANYKVKYDIGPTSDNSVYGIPATDSKIQFEDLVIFSMSYGLSANHVYPKISEPVEPIELQLGEPIIVGNQTRIQLFVSGGVQNVRAVSLSFTGQFGKLVSVEKGVILSEFTNPVMLMNNTEANNVYVDLAVFGAGETGVNTAGELITLVFEGNTNIRLNTADVRNILNGAMAVKISGSEGIVPTEYALMQNYPNPFNPTTTINYEIPVQAMVDISIFNALGERIATIVNEMKDAGRHTVEFNAVGYSSGIYFYQIKANDYVSAKKMILMK